jgi:hypothetical protein
MSASGTAMSRKKSGVPLKFVGAETTREFVADGYERGYVAGCGESTGSQTLSGIVVVVFVKTLMGEVVSPLSRSTMYSNVIGFASASMTQPHAFALRPVGSPSMRIRKNRYVASRYV